MKVGRNLAKVRRAVDAAGFSSAPSTSSAARWRRTHRAAARAFGDRRTLLRHGARPRAGDGGCERLLIIVGLGPGSPELTTPAVCARLAEATDLVGYEPYLARVPELPGSGGMARTTASSWSARDMPSSSRPRAARCRRIGRRSGRVRHGGGGVRGHRSGRAGLARARRPCRAGCDGDAGRGGAAGAPLGDDFCAISLSDNLKSWATIERRLDAAAQGDFVIALYNPASRARPRSAARRRSTLLRAVEGRDTIVLFVRAAGTSRATRCA